MFSGQDFLKAVPTKLDEDLKYSYVDDNRPPSYRVLVDPPEDGFYDGDPFPLTFDTLSGRQIVTAGLRISAASSHGA